MPQCSSRKRPSKSDEIEGKKRVAKMTCSQHHKELIGYCATCSIKICQDCIDGEHSQHEYFIRPKPKEEICKLYAAPEERRKELLACVDRVVEEKMNLLKFQKAQLESSCTQIKSCIDLICKTQSNGGEEDIRTIGGILSRIQKVDKAPQQKADAFFESTKDRDFVNKCLQRLK